MKTVNLAMARHHIMGLIAVAFAVLGGSALITAGLVIGETGLTSHVPAQRLAAVDVLVSAPQTYAVVEDIDLPLSERVRVDAGLIDDVSHVDGVAGAAGDHSFGLSFPGGTAEGHNWEVAALGGPDLDGRAPQGADEVVLDTEMAGAAGVDVGDRIALDVNGGTHARYDVVGLVDGPGTGAWFDRATATALADRAGGQVDLVAVSVEHGADAEAVAAAIESTVGDNYEVTTGDARGDIEPVAAGAARGELLALAGSLAGTLLVLVGCIVASAMSVSVANQRRDIALLRAVGATPRAVRRMLATQATVVALVALVPGVALGYVFTGVLAGTLTDSGMLPEGLELARSPIAAAVVTVMMVAGVQVASRCAAWRTSRMPATEAVAESKVEPKRPSRVRALVGIVLLLAALAPSAAPLIWRNETGVLASAGATMLGIVGLMLAGPALVRGLTGRAARRVSERRRVPAWLAVHNSHAFAARTAGAVGVLALAIGLTVTQFYVQSTLEDATRTELRSGLVADATVTGGFSNEDVEDLAGQSGVDAVVPMASTTVLHDRTVAGDPTTETFDAFAFGTGVTQVVDPEVLRGDLDDLGGTAIAVSEPTANAWGVDVGGDAEVVLANGDRVTAQVVALYERGFGFGSVMLSTDLLAGFGGDRWFDTVLVAGDVDAVHAWADGRTGAEVASGTALAGEDGSSSDTWIGTMVLLAMLGYVLVAVANSLVASTMRRRSEFAELRLIGATPRQVRAMVNRETGVLVALAIGAGIVVSVVPMSLLGLGVMGRPWPQGPLWVVPAVAATVALIAWGATRTSTDRALRTDALHDGHAA